jgi:CMP/dCMP kinase
MEKLPKSKLPEGFIVTIDGTAASGKGTTAAMVADHLGLIHIDSGAIYRAVALLALEREIALESEKEIVELLSHVSPDLLKDEKIRSEKVSSHVPHVAKISPVRDAVNARQKELARSHPKGAVIEGRDIGSKVFPDAHVKFFITATHEERGSRRHKQLLEKGIEADLEKIIEGLKKRDEEDMNRKVSPLVVPEGALHIDNTRLSKEEVLKVIIEHIYSKHS